MQLTGLRPENPLAVMAAYGALRLLPGALLRWDGVHPELHWTGDPIDRLVQLLPERRNSPELTLIDDPRQKHIEKAGGYAKLAEQMPHEWLSAYAAETADGIAPTELIAYGGNYTMIRAVRNLVDALAKVDVLDRVREALIGPWRYSDIGAGVALGWDANARQERAVLAAAPKGLGKDKPIVLAANWLAWEAIPAWQMINGRTPGITGANARAGHLKRWTYPTCAEWLSWDGIRALVPGWPQMSKRELNSMGVQLWQSEIIGRKEGGEFGLARTISGAKILGGSRRLQPPALHTV